MTKILYGIEGRYKDVTDLAYQLCRDGDMICIPCTDNQRAALFGDPAVNIVKHIMVDELRVETNIEYRFPNDRKDMPVPEITDPRVKLAILHSKVKFVGGRISDEYPEQLMAMTYIRPHHKVLELGSNIGRNTLVIASILSNQQNLVTCECDPNTCKVLEQNRDLNGYSFHIEPSAVSYRGLIQKGWNTIPSDEDVPGYTRINTITFEQLQTKYNIQFNTLVVDAEGALYYILMDAPQILDNITLLIVENDYPDDGTQKRMVDKLVKDKGFVRVFSQAGGFGASYSCFYEVWTKC